MNDLVLSGDFSNSGLGLGIEGFLYGETPVFHAVRVAEMLGYRDVHKAISQHCKSVIKLTYGEMSEVNIPATYYSQMGAMFIKESDLYRLIMHSKLPAAERFQDWVCEDVLPSIRKTGSYSLISQQLESTKAELSLANQRIENGHNIVRKLNREQKLLQSDLTSVTRVKNELELQNKALVFQLKGNRSELTIRQYLGVSGLSCYDANKKLIYDPREIVTWLTSQTFKGRDWNWKKAFTNAQYESIFFSSDVLVKHHNHIINMALEILEKSNH